MRGYAHEARERPVPFQSVSPLRRWLLSSYPPCFSLASKWTVREGIAGVGSTATSSHRCFWRPTITLFTQTSLIISAAVVIGLTVSSAPASGVEFGPHNPFFAPSSLPFQAPAFDKIKDEDYQPAIEAGMAEQRKEVQAIADNPASPTLENTIVAMEKSGQLLRRVQRVFSAVTAANTNPALQKVKATEAPKLAAHPDATYLDAKLFQRVATIYKKRNSLKLDRESLRLVEFYYDEFVHAGANLTEADKTELKKLN